MSDFLLELRCEEIPARMQAKASEDLARLFTERLSEAGLKAERITSYVTPRRLALIAHGLPLQTDAVSEEFKGPRTSAPEQALEGFLRKTGLTRDQLEDRDGVWFGTQEKPGRATADVLAEAIPAIIRAFPWPKLMCWGAMSTSTEMTRWVRPLQGIVALLGGNIVSCEVAGVLSGRTTLGHRFHSSGDVIISSPAAYAEELERAFVIVDQERRKQIIESRAKALAAEAGYELIEDAGLVAENAGLTEWPVPLLGHFDPAFLEVPPEVIQLTLRINQKYFVLRDKAGKLAPAFICTANIEAKDKGAAIVAGNGKVLAARLSDARFFWEQDKKTPLAVHAEKLSRITFHEKLGTVADKVERVAKLARWLVEEGIVGSGVPAKAGTQNGMTQSGSGLLPTQEHERAELADLAEQAARLAKADLVTEMVGEFPELQGLMGGYYAHAEGLPDAVADAIRDHYKPVGQGDDVPIAPVTVAVSLADKLDSLIHFFAVGERPSGSRDPFALRRAALGVISTIITNDIRLSLNKFFQIVLPEIGYMQGWQQAGKEFAALEAALEASLLSDEQKLKFIMDNPFNVQDLEQSELYRKTRDAAVAALQQFVDFCADRLKVQQKEAGVRHDLIDAVFALGGEDDLVRLLARVRALQGFIETPDGANLLAGYKRAANILKKEGVETQTVIPAEAGIQPPPTELDSRVRGNDGEYSAAAFSHSQTGEDNSGMPDQVRHDDLGYAPEPAEAALLAALDAAEPRAAAAIDAEDFEGAMAALATLRAPIDAFFESVIVNDPEPAKRSARLALLQRVRAAVHKVADFSKISG
jgi:glycyl-tRNA synthetase beta chain